MNINELERRTGITKQNIRFYEKKNLLHPARNTENNYRDYTEADYEILQTIKILRKLDFPIEDIRNILSEEVPLGQSAALHLKTLQEKRQELEACIEVCKCLLETDIHTLNIDETLQKIDNMERNGGKFMSIIQDYKKFAAAESKKHFSFKPDTMIQNSSEFTEALLQYAEENHLHLVITKEGMYPIFEIDGMEYTATRTFDRFGATIRCTLTHPEELDASDIPEKRKKLYRFLRSPIFIMIILLLVMAVSRNSIPAALIVGVMLLPYLFWLFPRIK